MKVFYLSLATLLLFSCGGNTTNTATNEEQPKIDDKKSEQINTVISWMEGTFSSSKQAANDSDFFDINLVMYPIWKTNQDAKWLYVEQAVSNKLDKPYRQRIYKVTSTNDGKISSAIFELPDAKKYIHAWETPILFDSISPDSLSIREGCAVILSNLSDTCFSGSTIEDKCKSSLYGASYATSEVSIFPDKVISWDRGFDSTNVQVWGAEKGGYIFDRIK